MSIQSTQTIDRQSAIERIKLIDGLVSGHEYREIELCTNEQGKSVARFVDEYKIPYKIEHIEKWSNDMLADVLSAPFFRRSFFDNYHVAE